MIGVVEWRDPQRPIWGLDWPYQVSREVYPPPSSGLPPGQRVPIFATDPQRPIWGLEWQYGFAIRSQGPASSVTLPPTPPPGAPWGSTGAAAPDFDAYGLYPTWAAQRGAIIASTITPPFVPGAPPPKNLTQFYSLRASWADPTWGPPQQTLVATLQPPPPATNPPPQSLINFWSLRLSWVDTTWVVQTAAQPAAILPFQPPPPPPAKPPFMPNLFQVELWQGIEELIEAGVLVPSALGYFSTYPISVIWVNAPQLGTQFTCPDGTVVYFPTSPGPGLIIAQSIPAGAHAAPNTPITLTVVEYPFSVTFP